MQLFCLCRGGGPVVSMLSFTPTNGVRILLTSTYSFYSVRLFDWNENKTKKRPGMAHLKNAICKTCNSV